MSVVVPLPVKRGRPINLPLEDIQLLKPAEVADIFRVSTSTVNRWAKQGKLTPIRTIGGHCRYRAADVQAFLNGERK